ncbi:hypothetical protein O7R08_15510 [Vibrio alginolyticus]|uniref:hypothetical protein n=4 Tax=Vibrio harveyi group TaxID=717610 RepID=UPI0022DD6617|nr:hypothetical protein [Vibrio alginolyticus]MDA0407348.1 hypothetical protein [Vibrio alginolyticus]
MAVLYSKLYEELQLRLFKNINPEHAEFIQFHFHKLTPQVLERLRVVGRIDPNRSAYFPCSDEDDFKISVAPFPITETCYIHYKGTSYVDVVLKASNKYYYVIALWLLWYDENKHSSLGREIVRAFIINSIDVMNEEALLTSDGIQSKVSPKEMRRKTVRFYANVFDFTRIYGHMTTPFKGMLKAHTVDKGVNLNKVGELVLQHTDEGDLERFKKRGFSKFNKIFEVLAEASIEDSFRLGGLLLLIKNSKDARTMKKVVVDLALKLNQSDLIEVA